MTSKLLTKPPSKTNFSSGNVFTRFRKVNTEARRSTQKHAKLDAQIKQTMYTCFKTYMPTPILDLLS